MGYFSRLSVEYRDYYAQDRSHPSAREQLIWRIEDLESRLETLTALHTHDYLTMQNDDRPIDELCRTVVAHTLPEHLNAPEDVLLALQMAREKLRAMDGENAVSIVTVLPGQMVLASMFAGYLHKSS